MTLPVEIMCHVLSNVHGIITKGLTIVVHYRDPPKKFQNCVFKKYFLPIAAKLKYYGF